MSGWRTPFAIRSNPGTQAPDKLPSISQLREEFKGSYGSVRGAMLVLKAGVGEGRQGDGIRARPEGERLT
jgi:hypothetical protein